MGNNTSQHIVSTAANLLGLCLFVITSLHITDSTESSIIDEFVSVIALLLAFSCLFSFISIRTKSAAKEKQFEVIADYLFIASLIGIVLIILLLVFHFIK